MGHASPYPSQRVAAHLGAIVRCAAACRPPAASPALAAATKLLEQFTIPNQTLAAPPASLPERTVARVVADGAFPAVVGRTDSLLVVGVEGNPPASAKPGFGVLVVDTQERVIGVMRSTRAIRSPAPRGWVRFRWRADRFR